MSRLRRTFKGTTCTNMSRQVILDPPTLVPCPTDWIDMVNMYGMWVKSPGAFHVKKRTLIVRAAHTQYTITYCKDSM